MSGLARSRQTVRVPLPSPFRKVQPGLRSVSGCKTPPTKQTPQPLVPQATDSHGRLLTSASSQYLSTGSTKLSPQPLTEEYSPAALPCSHHGPFPRAHCPLRSQEGVLTMHSRARSKLSPTGLDAGCLSSSSCYFGDATELLEVGPLGWAFKTNACSWFWPYSCLLGHPITIRLGTHTHGHKLCCLTMQSQGLRR